jgi:hypothetical protein
VRLRVVEWTDFTKNTSVGRRKSSVETTCGPQSLPAELEHATPGEYPTPMLPVCFLAPHDRAGFVYWESAFNLSRKSASYDSLAASVRKECATNSSRRSRAGRLMLTGRSSLDDGVKPEGQTPLVDTARQTAKWNGSSRVTTRDMGVERAWLVGSEIGPWSSR